MSHIQRPNSLWGIEFMTCNGQQVNSQRANIRWNLPDRLRSVGMHQRSMLVCNLRYFSNRLQRPSLVVGMHDCHQNGLVIDGSLYISRANSSISIHGQGGDAKAMQPCESTAHIEYRRRLSYLSNNVFATLTVC